MFQQFLAAFDSDFYHKLLHYAWVSAPIWVTFVLLVTAMEVWIDYKRREWIKSQGSMLLEIKLPRDILKTPLAMELVLNGIYEPVVGTLLDAFFGGKVRPWFSLEIASLGGQVKFFIWAFPKWKKNIEARLYAQYPGIEIHEVQDYALDATYDPETMSMAAFQTSLVKHDVYPIKTYVDFKLDKPGDEEEEKLDPLTSLIEWLGSLKPGEQAWYQIMIQAHRKEGLQDVKIFGKKVGWEKQVKAEIQKFIKDAAVAELEEGKKPRMLDLTKVQQETIEAIQRSQGKIGYETMIRMIYFAKKEDYNSMATAGMIHSLRPFGSANLNGIKPVFNGIDYPWQDFHGIRKKEFQRRIFDAYKRRSIFNVPYKNWLSKPYILNAEELATLYHFPGMVATTPGLTRIPSKRAEAPSNLPV